MKSEVIQKLVETFNSNDRSRDFNRGFEAAVRLAAKGDKKLAKVLLAEGWSL